MPGFMVYEFNSGRVARGRGEGAAMITHVPADCNAGRVLPSPEVIAALKDLYIISSAAAQLGGYGFEVSDTQKKALARKTLEAKGVLDRQKIARETAAAAALRQLVKMCEGIVDLYSTCQACPSAVWREVGRLGREAYEYIDERRIGQRRAAV
jgi:hypothetical protein